MATVLENLRSAGKSVDIAIVGDRAMRSLNRQFRGIDETTDVLSFPPAPLPDGRDGEDAPGSAHLGDIVLSVDEALRQAGEDGVPLEAAVDRLIIHGVLHLHGFEHDTARGSKRMRQKEARLLEHLRGPGLPAYSDGSPGGR